VEHGAAPRWHSFLIATTLRFMATISEALAIAIQHHQGDRLQAAEQTYRQILAVEPNHAEAHHLLFAMRPSVPLLSSPRPKNCSIFGLIGVQSQEPAHFRQSLTFEKG